MPDFPPPPCWVGPSCLLFFTCPVAPCSHGGGALAWEPDLAAMGAREGEVDRGGWGGPPRGSRVAESCPEGREGGCRELGRRGQA